MKASVVNRIQDLGVQVEFIPPGCTGLLQPVDVGYNKAFKVKLRTQYNEWLFEQDPDLPIPATTRRDVSDWILTAERNITDETIKNSWRKTGYSYFGVFESDGEFQGDDAIVGDDPNEPDNVEFGGEAYVDTSFESEDQNEANNVKLCGKADMLDISFESDDLLESSDSIVGNHDPNEPGQVEFGDDANNV
jgi:hypothetical protein